MALGANIGAPVQHLRAAVVDLAALPGTRVVARSSLYRSAPVGLVDQPDFINAVVAIDTPLAALPLLHALLANDLPLSLADEAAARDSAARLQAAVGDGLTITAGHDEASESWTLDIARMHHGNRKRTRIDADFLASGDYLTIRQASESISGLIGPGAVMRRGEKQQAVTRFADAIRWMLSEVERGISKQRYKGLGEMNPEQLWETTMDPNVRRLLRVQIEDAIGADEIFTTLMGELVEPRRNFIESNALAARNIDV